MSYINDSLNTNRRENYQRDYIRNYSEDNFIRNHYINYDKIYNTFLTSRYPPMNYRSSTIDIDNPYNDFGYKDELNNNNNESINNYQYRQAQTINSEYNNIDDYYHLNKNGNKNENEIRRRQQTSPNDIMIDKNYHFKKNEEDMNNYNNYQLTENSNNNNNDYNIENPYKLNDKELFRKRNDNNTNINMLDNNNNNINNNKLYQSYDNIKERINNRGYLSPIITKIAKKNFLGDNPYTDKEQNLGPSILKNNPILYPVNTYKFDFNRYIKNDYVNKYV